jgi:hypothetical protein
LFCLHLKKVLLKNYFIFLLLTILHVQLFSQRSWMQQVQYTIDVKLNDRHHSLDGFLKLKYTNNSSDTLTFLWIQLWPNAFKNDHTAYSDRMLDKGRNDFYFSEKEQKGYINRLVFRSGNDVFQQEDHPLYIDIIKVKLASPLLPSAAVTLGTPFHVQIPYNFSGFGHVGQVYTIQNWYPAVAEYTAKGWQPRPFTGQTQQVMADFEVTITLPEKYVVRTNGRLKDSLVEDTIKKISFQANNVNDFVWSAEKQGTKHTIPAKTVEQRVAAVIPEILSKKILPAAGYNVYDGFQAGILFHNFHEPKNKLTYFLAPMYATSSRKITGLAGINYTPAPGIYFQKIDIGLNASRFSVLKGKDGGGKKISGGFYKIAPYARFTFPVVDTHIENWIEFKTFIIGEKEFDYKYYPADSLYYPAERKIKIRYLNQVTFSHAAYRSLYPYDAQLQVQQANNFYRLNGELHYFFNYARGGGIKARLFAAKFGYIGNERMSDTYRYQPKLTAVRGDEDYTYGNPFSGRNEFDGFSSQQIMMRDGGFKLRTDMFQDLQGRSDNWVASMNLNTTLPNKIFPVDFPLRLFLDAGTYAGAWKKESAQPKFLYVAGLQLSLFKDLLNIYAPVLYSQVFKDNLNTVPGQNTFFKRISFSVDVQRFNYRRKF